MVVFQKAGEPCLVDEDAEAPCPGGNIPEDCVICPCAANVKILRRALEIHVIWEQDGTPIERQLPAEVYEGRALILKGELVGHYRNVRKLNIFIADLELAKPPSEDWIRRMATSKSIKVWSRAPEDEAMT